jgi:hypothetical protein
MAVIFTPDPAPAPVSSVGVELGATEDIVPVPAALAVLEFNAALLSELVVADDVSRLLSDVAVAVSRLAIVVVAATEYALLIGPGN